MTVVLHLFVDTLSVGGDLVEQMKETKKKQINKMYNLCRQSKWADSSCVFRFVIKCVDKNIGNGTDLHAN